MKQTPRCGPGDEVPRGRWEEEAARATETGVSEEGVLCRLD